MARYVRASSQSDCNMPVQKLRQSREVVTHGEEKINQKDEFSLYIKNKKQGSLLEAFPSI